VKQWFEDGLDIVEAVKKVSLKRCYISETFLARCEEMVSICQGGDVGALGQLVNSIAPKRADFFKESFEKGYYSNCIWLFLSEELSQKTTDVKTAARYVYQM